MTTVDNSYITFRVIPGILFKCSYLIRAGKLSVIRTEAVRSWEPVQITVSLKIAVYSSKEQRTDKNTDIGDIKERRIGQLREI
jgi:hypothetical protein